MDLTAPVLLVGVVVVASVLAWAVKPLMRAMVLSPVLVKERRQVHRLLTAGFVHGDSTHLLFNMITLWFFAGQVVSVLGEAKFLALYLSAVVVGFVPTVLRHAKNPKYTSLGASGAVAAVMFSAILLVPRLRLHPMFVPIPVPGIVYAGLYLGYSAWHSWRSRDGINHDAHFSGAIWGAALTFVLEPARVQKTLGQLF